MNLRLSAWVTGLTVLAVAGVAPRATAQELKIAVVDVDKIGDQYKELADRQKELQELAKQGKAVVAALQGLYFVSADEFQEGARIYQTPADQWTDAQKKREAELRKISTDNERIFYDLRAKPNRTAQETNQFNVLYDTAQARDRDCKAMAQAFDEELRKKREEVQQKLVANVRVVIEKVAKAMGLTIVLDKTAVLYVVAPVVDITNDVLKELNVGAEPGKGGGNAPAGGTENK